MDKLLPAQIKKSLFALALLPLFALANPSNSTWLPTKTFASKPDVSHVSVSPDGKHIASLVRIDTENKQGTAINLYNFATQERTFPVFVEDKKFVISDIFWANNDNLLVEAKFASSVRGTPITELHLMKYDLRSKKLKAAIPNSFMQRLSYIPNIRSNVIDILPDDPKHFLLQIAGHMHEGEPSVAKVALERGGNTHYVQPAEHDIFDWQTDRQGNVRIAIAKKDGVFTIYHVPIGKDSKSDFEKLWTFEAFSDKAIWPIGFGYEKNQLYVKALHQGYDAVFKVDLTSKHRALELVKAREGRDVTGHLRYSRKLKQVIGVGDYIWSDEARKFNDAINKALPDLDNHIVSMSEDENNYVVLATSDTEPGIYLMGDRNKKMMEVLAYRYNALTPEVLAEKKPISYQARDGLTIHGYLTKPKHAQEGQKLPIIIHPHGGPITFDGDGFDYWTQFFANRGYAVLQMNFRGSYGYGFDFLKQGIQAWGQAMQDDVEDATRWAIKQGIADPDKICIVGASYGGYAALMGAIKTPDLYKCAISFAGVTDVEALVKSSRNFTNYDIVKKQVGDDFDQLWQNSPLKHAQKINIPVLLIHGNKDRVVRFEQSEDMYDELKDANKEVKLVELEKGDHYLSNEQHRLTTFTEMESFLQRFL
ncbi:alpha/beta hydrolase family protein [Catenovulum agarivorans]|nr:S9 family peptidase [Catenovulum agarivorans]